MNSPKHHVKAAEAVVPQKSKEAQSSKKLKEIPMLNMFLKTLQPPSQYFSGSSDFSGISGNPEKETEESSSNTEVER